MTDSQGHRRWVVPALIALGVVVFLALASKRSGAAGIAQTQAATDPNALAAQALTLQAQQANAARSEGFANLDAYEKATLQDFNFGKQLTADRQVACPNGGLPRFIPNGSGGWSWGCIAHQSGGVTLGGILGTVAQAFGVSAGVPSTPPIVGGR